MTLTLSMMAALAGGSLGQCQSKSSNAMKTSYGSRGDIIATAREAGGFETLLAAVDAAGLTSTLQGDGPFTVFAPTNAAFDKLPAGTVASLLEPGNRGQLTAILTYHVAPRKLMAADVLKRTAIPTVGGQAFQVQTRGSTVMIDNATVVKTDIPCSNGVIHVIDTVIMPSTSNIVETALSAGSFNTLAKALGAAGLVETLQGAGPYTVFAPTDDAFAKLPAGTLATLLDPANKAKLQAVLTYHVVSGRIFAEDAITAGHAATVEGSKVRIARRGGQPMVNDARIVQTDINTTNGVIHVIDTVLLPDMD